MGKNNKISKEEFIAELTDDYEFDMITEYYDLYFENLLSIEENIKNFKDWADEYQNKDLDLFFDEADEYCIGW